MSTTVADQVTPASRSVWSWRAGSLVGALSALVALAVAELLALVLPGRPSPIVGIANQIINLTPAGIRESLISAVGTADKPVLTVGIVTVILVLGAVVGARFRDSALSAWPVYLILGLGVGLIAGAATAQIWSSLIAGLIGGAAGWATLALLLRTTVTTTSDAGGDIHLQSEPALARRTFLIASAGVAGAAVAGVAVLAAVRSRSLQAVESARDALRLPKPARPASALPVGAGVDVPDMPPPVTPNDVFYRIDTALVPPTVSVEGWTLRIGGKVDQPFSLSYQELMSLPQVEQYVTLACVSNPVGGDLVGNALWQGVPLRALLERAGVAAGAQQIVAESVDGFTAAFPITAAMDGRDAMVAVGMNRVPLPVNHGFPARLVVPGLYGYVSATKWLREIRLTTFAEEVGFWIPRGWVADGTIEAASRIDVPEGGATVPAGEVTVAGRAWHQRVPIGAVEVSVDAGPWQAAQLATSMGVDTWRLWSWKWSATVGGHELRVRMIDANGKMQSPAVRGPGPGASSGYQSIVVDVS
ncbi:MAG: molybdopterin-dependent oxidoreductase [Candidatus Nanopelagicales bacterium]